MIIFDAQCCGSGINIPDPIFSIRDLGSRVDKIPDLGSKSTSKNLSNFTQKTQITTIFYQTVDDLFS
jgi:hypothetical protein